VSRPQVRVSLSCEPVRHFQSWTTQREKGRWSRESPGQLPQFIHFLFLICSSSVIDLVDRSSHRTASGCDPRLIATCTYLGQTTTRLVRCSGHALHWRRRSSDDGEVASSTYDTTPYQGRCRPGLGSTDPIRLTFMDQQRTTKQGTQHSNITWRL
jgi:hypothetical protein